MQRLVSEVSRDPQRFFRFHPPAQRALGRWMKTKKPLRIAADLAHQALHFGVKTHSQLNADDGMILDGFEVLLAGLRMKDRTLHRPRIRLAFSNTSSAGMP